MIIMSQIRKMLEKLFSKPFHRKQNTWVCVGGTHVGKSHIVSKFPCQDKIAFVCDSDKTVCALCDGLGSRENSHFGAVIISDAAVDYLANNFDSFFELSIEEAKKNLLLAINKKIDIYSFDDKITKSSLECTLLFIAISRGKYVLGKIGDGVLGLCKNKRIVDNIYLTKGNEEVEFANSTFTVLDEDAEKHLEIKTGDANDVDGFFLVSDGLPFLSSKGKTASKIFDFLQMINDTNYALAKNLIYGDIANKVRESDFYLDDWSFVFGTFLKKPKKSQLKSYYQSKRGEDEEKE